MPGEGDGDDPTCQEIQEFAFDTHVCCYVDPLPGSGISFCSLPPRDQLVVAFVLRESFVELFEETVTEGIKVEYFVAYRYL